MKKKIAILGVALMGMSLLSGCGNSATSTRLPDYSEYVTLGEYTGLSYTPMSVEITDEDVDSELDSFVQGLATENEVTDRAAQVGDDINIDYVGTVDGVEFDGGSTDGQGATITLGESGYIDNFDEQLVGMKPGETKEVNVTFPDPYENDESLSGKAAVFTTTLNSITETVVPELTDQLVADNTDCTTIDEYKTQIRADLEAEAKEDAENDAIDQLLDAAAKNATFSAYPEDEIKKLIDDTIAEIKQTATAYSIDYATYIYYFYQCETEEDFENYLADSAKEYMEQRMVACEIAKKEKISVSDEEIKEYVEQLVKDYELDSTDEVYESYTDADIEYMLLAEKVGALLKKSAVEVEATTEETTDDEGLDTVEEDTTEEASDDTTEASEEETTKDTTSEAGTTEDEAATENSTSEDGTTTEAE